MKKYEIKYRKQNNVLLLQWNELKACVYSCNTIIYTCGTFQFLNENICRFLLLKESKKYPVEFSHRNNFQSNHHPTENNLRYSSFFVALCR